MARVLLNDPYEGGRQPVRVPVAILSRADKTAAGLPMLRVRAAIDSMAEITCVSEMVVKQLGLWGQVRRAPRGTVMRAYDDTEIARIGTITLTIGCGDAAVAHECEVIKGSELMLLGPDLYSRFGIYLGGLPTDWPGGRTGEAAANRAREEEEVLRERPRPWAVEDQVPSGEREVIMKAIEPLVRANEAIPVSAVACESIPDAVMRIPLTVTSSWRSQYPIPEAAMPAVRERVKLWADNGFIEPGNHSAPFNSPLLAAGKKDLQGRKTDWRICVDARHLNAAYDGPEDHAKERMPHLSEVFLRMRGFTHCSTIDLTGGYHQFAIAKEDRDKTSFTAEGRRWRWRRWFFGMRQATAQFQRVMEQALDGLEGVAIYVDDLCIYTKGSAAEHARLVAEVLKRLNHHKLRINRAKCHFGYRRVLLLGHFVAGSSRAVDPLKVQQAFEWPQPRTGKQVERLLGFTNYIRDYIPMYARLTEPLERLKKKKHFDLEMPEHAAGKASFKALVQAINSAEVLHAPVPELQLQVATDACQYGLGAVLYQEVPQPDGKERRQVIAFAATSLHGAQRSYPATARELLGMMFALRKFHHYLFGREFIMYTDHDALTSMFTKKELSHHVKDWLDTILQYDFEVRHRPGVKMVLSDALSRIFDDLDDARVRQELATVSSPLAIRAMRVAVPTDELTKHADKELREFIAERLLKTLVTDQAERDRILRTAHADGHFGAEELYKQVWRGGFYWPGLRQQCREVVAKCLSCLQHNVRSAGFHPAQSPNADNAWDHVATDLAVDLPESEAGFKHILILVDVATRFVVTKPLRDKSMESVARAMYEVFALFGPPKIIQSDNGTEFVNEAMAKLAKAAGVDHRLVAAYNPRANGVAERFVKTVKDTLHKKLAGALGRWDDALPGVTMAINAKDARITGTAPFTLFFGRARNRWDDYTLQEITITDGPRRTEADAAREVAAQLDAVREAVTPVVRDAVTARQRKQNDKLDNSRKLITEEFPPGSLVMLDNPFGTTPRRVGPFLVVRRNRGLTYTLQDLNRRTLERHFPVSQLSFVASTAVPLTTPTGGTLNTSRVTGVVTAILHHRKRQGTTENEFLVRWDTHPNIEDSWVTAAECPAELLVDYWKRTRPSKRSQGSKRPPAPLRRKRKRTPAALHQVTDAHTNMERQAGGRTRRQPKRATR